MKKMKRKIFILFFVASLFLSQTALAEESHFYSRIINYLQREREAEVSLKLELGDFAVLFTADILLSLLCLWLSILLLAGIRILPVKRYLWFLFIFNLIWFILLLLFRGVWQVLDFLVVRLRPDLAGVILDNFSLAVIVTAMLIYIWLLARTFSLNFFGALGTFFTSHLLYFIIISLFFLFLSPKENRLFNLVKENLGPRPIIHSYLSDINKITAGQNILSFVRIRPFHL